MTEEQPLRFFSFCEQELITRSGKAAPAEACGLIFATRDATWPRDSQAFVASQTRNVDRQPTRAFTIDPLEWLAHEEAAAKLALEVRGYWHSHPCTSPTMSEADALTIASLGSGTSKWLFAIVGLGADGSLVLEVHDGASLARTGSHAHAIRSKLPL